MSKRRLFVDSDIIIDLLARREHFLAASQLFSLIEEKVVEGCTTPIVLANIAYIMGKYSGRTKPRRAVRALINSLTILQVDGVIASTAVESKFKDFEDALQYYAAENGKVDIIVTRNKKDYVKGSIAVMTAEEFADLHSATSEQPEA